MTTLLYVKDYLKEKLKAEVLQFYFDEDNMTNEEEILQEKMIEEVLVKVVTYQEGSETDGKKEESKLDEHESIYVNNKGQLIKITPVERNGKMTELHQILSFDVDKLPQAVSHKYGGDNKPSKLSQLTMVPRAKVPVKDGRSQNKFIQENVGRQNLVSNPNEIFYTMEEVAQHKTDEDCWTVLNGKIYDVTEYAKVHPGGRKIFLGKGKDCTKLYNEYHPWVNGAALIGKYWVGVLKQ